MVKTITPGELIPDALATRLAGHYAPNARAPLAVLYWTGMVLPGTHNQIARRAESTQIPEHDSCGRRDPQAILAELRALAHYCKVNDGREEVNGWRAQRTSPSSTAWWENYEIVVPWAWREVEPT